MQFLNWTSWSQPLLQNERSLCNNLSYSRRSVYYSVSIPQADWRYAEHDANVEGGEEGRHRKPENNFQCAAKEYTACKLLKMRYLGAAN